MSSTDVSTMSPATLIQLANRVRRLCPDRRDPEAFHVEKDAIERELRRLAGRSPVPRYTR